VDWVDPDSQPGRPVFNRTVTLRDTWAKIQAKGGASFTSLVAPASRRQVPCRQDAGATKNGCRRYSISLLAGGSTIIHIDGAGAPAGNGGCAAGGQAERRKATNRRTLCRSPISLARNRVRPEKIRFIRLRKFRRWMVRSTSLASSLNRSRLRLRLK